MNTQTTTTPDDLALLDTTLNEIRGGWANIKELPATVTRLEEQIQHIRRSSLALTALRSPRPQGSVSEECGAEIAARVIAHCAKCDMLEALCSVPSQRDTLLAFSRSRLNLSTRAALTTAEIPLPVQYGREIRELISEFGVVRRLMSHYPIGMGTSRPARMGARPAFGSIAMSAAFPEKSPSLTFASLESHKLGGVVRLPREIDEQSIVSMGQFLARYGAVEFARAEDNWGFLADGSGTYEAVKGIIQTARENAAEVIMATTKTHPSDATLDDFRAMRREVDKAALNGRISAYYLDTTWESRLPGFKTPAEPNVYFRRPDGTAVLDGYPIVWTDVLEPYGTAPAPNKTIAVFGALSFWWFGEHAHPRIDTSSHVWFANDQLAVRFIEEIDFDYAAANATSALTTAGA